MATAALVGGTASSLGGGSFSNGAMTGAFVRMFNDVACHAGDEDGDGTMSAKSDLYNFNIQDWSLGTFVRNVEKKRLITTLL